jgi:hypothetical protein
MRFVVRIVFIALFVSFLAGCATTGPKFTEISPKMWVLAPDKGRIYIYRTTTLGAAVQPDVKINGEVVGSAVPRGFFYVDRQPGTYQMLVSTEVDRTLSLLLEEGQTRYVRLNVSMGFFMGHVYPELIDSEDAQKEIADCRYTGQEKIGLKPLDMK